MNIDLQEITKKDTKNILNLTSNKNVISTIYDRKIWNEKDVNEFIQKNLEEQKINIEDRENFNYILNVNKNFSGIISFLKVENFKRYFVRIIILNEKNYKRIITESIKKLITKFKKKKPYEKKLYIWIDEKNKELNKYAFLKFEFIREFIWNEKKVMDYVIHLNFDNLLMDYPYYKNYIKKEEILYNYSILQNYKPKLINKLVSESILSFEESYYKNEKINRITDYFTEECRVICNFNKNQSPYDFFKKNRDLFENKMNYRELDKIIYKNTKFCSNFNITIVFTLLNYFKPKSYLDFSSGWGDRLIGAMAYGCKYQGIDPSECLNEIYPKIVNFFNKSTKNYNVIKKGFEDVNLEKSKFDLVFTSPPFYDLEVYQNKETQSINKFNTVEKWKNNFLFPSLDKSIKHLNKEGHLAIYISDYGEIKYTQDMKRYLNNKKDCRYIGTINWINIDSSKNIRYIYIWKKIK
jgi:tRNA1(Val) A37 N6-methylase TrmN6